MGSGTTIKVALNLDRHAVGYEIDVELLDTVKEKVGLGKQAKLVSKLPFEIITREDAKHLRTKLQEKVEQQKSVTKESNKVKKQKSKKVSQQISDKKAKK
jgi:hypothetical protein